MRRLWAAGPAIVLCLVLTGAPALAQSGSAGAANEWPFMRTSCPGAAGEPMRLVALGTSETAGWGVRADEAYSPQEAYPARYADILCEELGRPVELHSYFPDRFTALAPLAWWNERLSGDEAMRADLAAADVVAVWALSVHDFLPALMFGQCRGEWPDPLRACFEEAGAEIEPQMDTAFSTIATLVPDTATILATDGYAPPKNFEAWGAEPYFAEMEPLTNPHYVVERLAAEHGFTMVGTAAALSGPSLSEPPPDGLFQVDGLHPTALGEQLMAEVMAQEDGLGE